MDIITRGCMICIVLIIVIESSVSAAPTSDTTIESEGSLRGQFLIELGTNFSNPLLRLLGKTFKSYEDDVRQAEERLAQLTENICRLHPCTEWEAWTRCPVAYGYSMVTRSRTCTRSNDILCSDQEITNLPTLESKVCEEWCPGDTYNRTNGYCVRLVKTSMTQYDAHAACQEDGGHLVNIDTKDKSDAVHEVLRTQGITSEEVWINGNRTAVGGDWKYTYGSVPDFANWGGSEPSDGSDELCKCDLGTSRVWFDRPCYRKYYFVCELVS